ncbi:MAG: signal peptidase II [Bacillota bacterium]|nr:signal peptidase II [Bacillota bacterium]
MGLAIMITLVIVLLDQITKYLIVNNLALDESIIVIKDFFSIHHIRNSGAAWGIFSDKSWGIHLLTIISLVASLFILYLIFINKIRPAQVLLALILGGSLGNLIDRVRYNNVVDFLSFKFGTYYFPNFNVADMSIVVGAICLAVYFMVKPDQLEQIRISHKADQKTNEEK